MNAYKIKHDFDNNDQVKYLGIIIEKDDEYSFKFCASERIKREYVSTRGKYMEITRDCRKLSDKCMSNGRGAYSLQKSSKKLLKKAKQLKLINRTSSNGYRIY